MASKANGAGQYLASTATSPGGRSAAITPPRTRPRAASDGATPLPAPAPAGRSSPPAWTQKMCLHAYRLTHSWSDDWPAGVPLPGKVRGRDAPEQTRTGTEGTQGTHELRACQQMGFEANTDSGISWNWAEGTQILSMRTSSVLASASLTGLVYRILSMQRPEVWAQQAARVPDGQRRHGQRPCQRTSSPLPLTVQQIRQMLICIPHHSNSAQPAYVRKPRMQLRAAWSDTWEQRSHGERPCERALFHGPPHPPHCHRCRCRCPCADPRPAPILCLLHTHADS